MTNIIRIEKELLELQKEQARYERLQDSWGHNDTVDFSYTNYYMGKVELLEEQILKLSNRHNIIPIPMDVIRKELERNTII